MASFNVIAFDFGLKNIGAAVGQSVTQSASELKPLSARDGIPNWDDLESLLSDWQPKTVIVGLPLNMDDSESELSKRARKFGNRVHGRFGYDVEFMDERLSTREAKDIAREQGHHGNYGENPIDSLAACIILQSWWQERGTPPS